MRALDATSVETLRDISDRVSVVVGDCSFACNVAWWSIDDAMSLQSLRIYRSKTACCSINAVMGTEAFSNQHHERAR